MIVTSMEAETYAEIANTYLAPHHPASQLLAEARDHDRHVTYSPEAAYVAQHRPY